MQLPNAAYTRAKLGERLFPCASWNCFCIPLLLMPKIVWTPCNLHWWCFLPLTGTITTFSLMVVSPVTCTVGIFHMPTSMFTYWYPQTTLGTHSTCTVWRWWCMFTYTFVCVPVCVFACVAMNEGIELACTVWRLHWCKWWCVHVHVHVHILIGVSAWFYLSVWLWLLTLFCIFSFPYWVPQSSLWLMVPQVQ